MLATKVPANKRAFLFVQYEKKYGISVKDIGVPEREMYALSCHPNLQCLTETRVDLVGF